jgi:hypothetical protein
MAFMPFSQADIISVSVWLIFSAQWGATMQLHLPHPVFLFLFVITNYII